MFGCVSIQLCFSWPKVTFFSTCPGKVLADIELAQTLKSETEKAQEETIETVPHPADQDYKSLHCRLTLVDTGSDIYKVPCHKLS